MIKIFRSLSKNFSHLLLSPSQKRDTNRNHSLYSSIRSAGSDKHLVFTRVTNFYYCFKYTSKNLNPFSFLKRQLNCQNWFLALLPFFLDLFSADETIPMFSRSTLTFTSCFTDTSPIQIRKLLNYHNHHH